MGETDKLKQAKWSPTELVKHVMLKLRYLTGSQCQQQNALEIGTTDKDKS